MPARIVVTARAFVDEIIRVQLRIAVAPAGERQERSISRPRQMVVLRRMGAEVSPILPSAPTRTLLLRPGTRATQAICAPSVTMKLGNGVVERVSTPRRVRRDTENATTPSDAHRPRSACGWRETSGVGRPTLPKLRRRQRRAGSYHDGPPRRDRFEPAGVIRSARRAAHLVREGVDPGTTTESTHDGRAAAPRSGSETPRRLARSALTRRTSPPGVFGSGHQSVSDVESAGTTVLPPRAVRKCDQ